MEGGRDRRAVLGSKGKSGESEVYLGVFIYLKERGGVEERGRRTVPNTIVMRLYVALMDRRERMYSYGKLDDGS